MKINKHIEIVRSTEAGLSSLSQKSHDSILVALSKKYTHVGSTIVNCLADLELLVMKNPDLVFLGTKFIPVHPGLGWQDPDKIWLADYLAQNDILYTGSGQKAHNLELNKQLAKQRALDVGVETSPFCLIKQGKLPKKEEIILSYPLFVKPANRGGGLGIDSYSVVHNFEQLLSKIQSVTDQTQSDSMIEEYLPGREFSVAILRDENSDEYSIMPLELVAPTDKNGFRILSEHVKSADTERFIGLTDSALKTKIINLAIEAFCAIGARDYGRIDIRLDKNNIPHFLEANLIPSLLKDFGNFPKACMLNIGLGYEDMLFNIVSLAFERNIVTALEAATYTGILPSVEVVA